jgi:hypothetical protein
MLGDFIEHCYDAMGRPAVTRSSVWNVYRNVLSAVQLAENPHPNLLLTTENEGAATGALTLISGHVNLPFNEEPDGMCYSHPILFSHYASSPFCYASLSPCCFLMLSLSLTHPDSSSHEPSFLVLQLLVRAYFFSLFKNVVTACISLT